MTDHDSRVTALLVLACPAFVFGALGVEILAAQYANSATPGWAELFPLAWPTGARVVWWLVVAAAVVGFRAGLARIGFRPRGWVTVVNAAPFVVFAAGIAAGADFATWH